MSPQLALMLTTLIVQYGPEFVQALITIFNTPNPTLDQWNAAFALAKNPIAQISDMPATKPVSAASANLPQFANNQTPLTAAVITAAGTLSGVQQ